MELQRLDRLQSPFRPEMRSINSFSSFGVAGGGGGKGLLQQGKTLLFQCLFNQAPAVKKELRSSVLMAEIRCLAAFLSTCFRLTRGQATATSKGRRKNEVCPTIFRVGRVCRKISFSGASPPS